MGEPTTQRQSKIARVGCRWAPLRWFSPTDSYREFSSSAPMAGMASDGPRNRAHLGGLGFGMLRAPFRALVRIHPVHNKSRNSAANGTDTRTDRWRTVPVLWKPNDTWHKRILSWLERVPQFCDRDGTHVGIRHIMSRVRDNGGTEGTRATIRRRLCGIQAASAAPIRLLWEKTRFNHVLRRDGHQLKNNHEY